MQDVNIQGKKVAVFGLGDSVSYSENYADATGELHDVFEKLGCKMMGYTSQEGYEHEASKAIRGDLFCGLLCDVVNQEEMTEERVINWVQQLIAEGILEGGSGASTAAKEVSTPTIDVTTMAQVIINDVPSTVSVTTAAVREKTEQHPVTAAKELSKNAATQSVSSGYFPHYNPRNGRTMWTSSDGKTCFYQ